MTQPEETTAALIARLHEELKESKAECLQWRKDIDEERTVRQTHEGRSQSLHRALAKERSAFEAAESARIAWAERCIAIEKERDEFRASHAALDRLLAERTRERDEAIQRRREVCERFDITVESLRSATKQRDSLQLANDQNYMRGKEAMLQLEAANERIARLKTSLNNVRDLGEQAAKDLKDARELLTKLEWAGLERPSAGGPLLACCIICQGFKDERAGSRFFTTADRVGHRPTCWFAKKEAGANKIRNHRKGCPARTADDVAWVDSQWQVNGCRTSPIEGPRPNPIGCEGCKCTTAKEGAAKPPTPREQWKTKQAHYDHWLDAVGYRLLDVDWAKGNSVTVTTNRPVQPGAAFVYDQPSGIWKLVDKPADEPARCSLCLEPDVTSKPHPHARCKDHDSSTKEPARPEPRFKVGEKVVHERGSGEICGMFWSQADGWQYQLRSEQPLGIGWPRESSLKPAPKFAVGEWVTWLSAPLSEGGHVCSGPVLRRWFADITNDGWWYEVPWRLRERDHTAQAPQHKHDCKGCVCLGKKGEHDLYFCAAHPGMSSGGACLLADRGLSMGAAHVGSNCTSTEILEARRRAVARGLVKP